MKAYKKKSSWKVRHVEIIFKLNIKEHLTYISLWTAQRRQEGTEIKDREFCKHTAFLFCYFILQCFHHSQSINVIDFFLNLGTHAFRQFDFCLEN